MQLHSLQGFSKIEGLFQILHQLSLSDEFRFTSPEHTPVRELKVTDRLLPVFKFTSENLHSQVSLQEVAALADMSEHSFSRFFRSRMRKTFSQYMKDQRLKTACNLLLETDKPISEIGELCGYRSTSHFIQIFRSYNHQTPLSYRNEKRRHSYS
jgi:transcriptional regulator GlxA family with amidase domain